MNGFKNILFLFIITLLLLIFCNQSFSKVSDNYKTLYLGRGNKITILIPDNWHLQNKINYIFVDKNAPKNLEVTLLKKILKYNNPQHNLNLINAHKKMLLSKLKVKPTEIKEGFDNIEGYKVPWILIFTKNNASVKFLYPSINNNTYIICVGFKGNAPFKDAEILINEIVKGIQNKNNPTQIVKTQQASKPVAVAKKHYPKAITTQKKNLLMEKTRSAQIISQSPNIDELKNGTVLYSKAINIASPFGKELYKEHTYLANQSISEIHSLSNNFHQARTLNKHFYQNIGDLLLFWDQTSKKDPSLKDYLALEKLIYATSLDYQLKENYYWAAIDAIIEEIQTENHYDKRPVNESIIKSLLYTKLLLSYTDLAEFYNTQNEILFPYCAFSHASEQNAGSNIPSNILKNITPLHNKELKLIEDIFTTSQKYQANLNNINSKSDKLKAFYNKMDNYSLKSINKTITEMEEIASRLRTQNDSIAVQTDSLITLESYITYYKELKSQLESKIITYEIKETVLASLKNKEVKLTASINTIPLELVLSGILDEVTSFKSFKEKVLQISKGSLDNGKKVYRMAKSAPSVLLACADYTIGKTAETYYDYQAKKALKEAYPDDYEKFIQDYNEFSEIAYVVSIKDTFIDPLKATLSGDSQNGIGQAGINNFKDSAKKVDQSMDKLTGSTFASQIILNVTTVGGYGLAKDFMTLNDNTASASDKAWAALGTAMNFIPISNASKAIHEGNKKVLSSLSKNIAQSQNSLAKYCSKLPNASIALKNNTTKVASFLDDIISSSGKVINSDDLAKVYGDQVFKQNITQQVIKASEKDLTTKIMKEIVSVPAKTTLEGGATAIKTFFKEMAPDAIAARMKEMSKLSLSQVVKNSESFVGKSLANSIGIQDITNFIISSTVDNAVNDGIKVLAQKLTTTGDTDTIPSSNSYTSNNEVSASSTYPEYENNYSIKTDNSLQQNNNQQYQPSYNKDNIQSWGQNDINNHSQNSSQTWTSNTANTNNNQNNNSSNNNLNSSNQTTSNSNHSNNTNKKININYNKIQQSINSMIQKQIHQNNQMLYNLNY